MKNIQDSDVKIKITVKIFHENIVCPNNDVDILKPKKFNAIWNDVERKLVQCQWIYRSYRISFSSLLILLAWPSHSQLVYICPSLNHPWQQRPSTGAGCQIERENVVDSWVLFIWIILHEYWLVQRLICDERKNLINRVLLCRQDELNKTWAFES